MKIALLPGGFKPPHLGHYNMAKYLADFADKVIIRIGQKEREGIGKELALEIWNYYKEFDPDSRSGKLVISVAQSPSAFAKYLNSLKNSWFSCMYRTVGSIIHLSFNSVYSK